MVPFVSFRFPSVLNAYRGTPLDACEALLAAAVPDGSPGFHGDISYRADLFTDTAGVARAVDMEILVHCLHEIIGHFVEGGE